MFSSVLQISHLPPYAGECCVYDLLSDCLVEMLAKLNLLSPVLMSHHPFGSSRFELQYWQEMGCQCWEITPVVLDVSDTSSLMLQSVLQSYSISPQKLFC